VVGFEMAMRRDDFVEGEHTVDDGPQQAAL